MKCISVGVAVAAAWISLGCGPFIDEVNAKHGAKVEPKLSEVRAVGKRLEETPRLSADKAPPVEINIVLSSSYSAAGNAALLYAEDFGNLDELGFVYARLRDANLVQRCSAPLHTEHLPWDPSLPELTPSGASGSSAERAYSLLEGLEYVAVLRTTAFAKPQVGGSRALPAPSGAADAGASEGGVSEAGAPATADAGSDAGTSVLDSKNVYSGGYLAAELLLFRLAGPELLGGVRFEAESSETLSGSPTDIGLEEDLRSKIRTALKDSLSKSAPKVQVRE